MAKKKTDYGLAVQAATRAMKAQNLPYRPRDPKKYWPNIALIACGGITEQHLKAYKAAGYNVAALCDADRAKAEKRREEFYPRAKIYTNYREALRRDDIEVVDIATHPEERLPILRAAIEARKHVLSQKPFVIDLDEGRRLVELAKKRNVKLAVNQNGRWAPHFSYIRHAIAAGLIGDVFAAHLSVHWNHNWIKGTHFENVRHIVLYDFAIHWFDVLTTFINRNPRRVFASFTASPSQQARPALLAQALVEYENAQATLVFDADVKFGQRDTTYVAGSAGTISSSGPSLTEQTVTLHTERGYATPKLKGNWFPDGFHGTMAELLCAIEENREPSNSAENNLNSLALCFAAVESAETGKPQIPGKVRKLHI
ncbi:MAG TPA: Gfo/Idh/MocA family oxidoreductase [Tepidisphaeraceae bacterium]|jgi:predicted dehydrogenase|nr:Gfo/Idh/MocA family oxidoreductase [Tepidisphaeraceae bacterium]